MSDQLLGTVTLFESEVAQFNMGTSPQSRLDTMKSWLDESAAMGSQVVRIPASWAQLEPYEGWYSQGYIDEQIELMAYAAKHDIQVIYEFALTPEWARQLPNEPFSPPTNNQDYADALAHIYSAFMEAGVSDTIAGLEVWNEPNVSLFWPGADYRYPELANHAQGQGVDGSVDYAAAVAYTNLLNTAYDAVKAVDADATVLGGSLAGTDLTYLQWMLDNGAQMDGLAVHPYTRNYDGQTLKPARPGDDPNAYAVDGGLPEDLNQRFSFEYGLNELNTMLKNAGMEDVNLWITEMGWRIEDYDDGNTNDDHLIVADAEEQASYIQEALDILSTMDFVSAATIFQLYDAGDGDFGLIDENGVWRPSAEVLSNHIEEMENQEVVVDQSSSYNFAQGDGQLVIEERADADSIDTLNIADYAHDGMILTRSGDDLIITQPNPDFQDEIVIRDQFSDLAGSGVEAIRFPGSLNATGEAITWSRSQIEAYTDMSVERLAVNEQPIADQTIYGTIESDVLDGTEANDLIISDAGDDVVIGSAGDDIIVGVSGYDQVDYLGEGSAREDFIFTKNADGSITASSDQFGTDLMWDVDAIWFEQSAEWVEMDELAV